MGARLRIEVAHHGLIGHLFCLRIEIGQLVLPMFMMVSDLTAVPSEDSFEWHAPSPIAHGRRDVADADSTPLRVKVYARPFVVGKIQSGEMRAAGRTGVFRNKGLFIRPKLMYSIMWHLKCSKLNRTSTSGCCARICQRVPYA